MAFNISEFKTNIAKGGGLLKNNKFLVLVPTPRILQGKSIDNIPTSSTNDILRFHAEKASIPGIALQASEMRRQGIGNLEKTPFGAAFTDCDVSFTIDQKSTVWNFFQSWMDGIYNFNLKIGNGLYELAYKNEYCTTLTLYVYNEIHPQTPVIQIELIDAFPVSISDIPLQWSGGEHITLNVRFNFRSWNEIRVGTSTYAPPAFRSGARESYNDPTQPTVNSRQIPFNG